jgi:DNA-binding HxlR family transcriptional regulator
MRSREIIIRGEYAVKGLRSKDLRHHLHNFTPGQISRRLKNLRVHGMVKRIGRTYKYYLTELGCHMIVTVLKLKELFIVPQLAKPATI